jgi:hypothetical protein
LTKITEDFEELDGEGVAYAAPYFYVVARMAAPVRRANSAFPLSSSRAFASIRRVALSMPLATS